MLIKYIKSVLWRVAKRLSYIEDARCLKVKGQVLGCSKFCNEPSVSIKFGEFLEYMVNNELPRV